MVNSSTHNCPYIVTEVDCKSNYVYLVPCKLTTIRFPHTARLFKDCANWCTVILKQTACHIN